jgi:NADH:ubiquinone oxidoreductase subunit 6 (subunit J)
MLTRRELQDRAPQTHLYGPLAALLAALAFAGIAWGLSNYVFFDATPPDLPAVDMTVELGSALIDPLRFLPPFEAVSVLLLSALIGAVLVAGGTGPAKRPPEWAGPRDLPVAPVPSEARESEGRNRRA